MFTILMISLGYVGSKSFLEEVVNVLSDLRKVNPNLVFGWYIYGIFTYFLHVKLFLFLTLFTFCSL